MLTAKSLSGHRGHRCHSGLEIPRTENELWKYRLKHISAFMPDPTVKHLKEFAWYPKWSKSGDLIWGTHWRIEKAYHVPNGKKIVISEDLYTEYEYFWAKLGNDIPEPTQ